MRYGFVLQIDLK